MWTTRSDAIRERLNTDGYFLLPGVVEPIAAGAILTELMAALSRGAGRDPAVLGGEGAVYGARNLLEVWPEVDLVWRRPSLVELLSSLLGESFGLVRVLYFDKVPGNSWALPWHKDLTVCVRDNRLPSSRFRKPTRKAGLPHVEAPVEVLEGMLTARLHLDRVDDENGPLRVVPGSHRTGKVMQLDGAPVRSVHAAPGDVLLMRPLLAHCSNHCRSDTDRHRRILHLEFAAGPELPDGYAFYQFLRGEAVS